MTKKGTLGRPASTAEPALTIRIGCGVTLSPYVTILSNPKNHVGPKP